MPRDLGPALRLDRAGEPMRHGRRRPPPRRRAATRTPSATARGRRRHRRAGDRPQVRSALEAGEVAGRISPPQTVPSRPKARAVEDRANDRGRARRARRRTRRDGRGGAGPRAAPRPGRPARSGWRDSRDGRSCATTPGDVEQALEVRDALAEGAQRLGVREVADVVADPRARRPSPGRRCSSAPRPRRACGAGAGSGSAMLAGTYPRERRASARRARRRLRLRTTESSVRMWIGRSCSQEALGDRCEALRRLAILVGDRLVAEVAAGHHQRRAGPASAVKSRSQQVVKRGVGQHHAEVRAAGRDRRRRAPACQPARGASTIGRAASKQRGLGVARARRAPRGGEVRRHQRERLVLAALARPQPARPPLVVGAAGEVVAAEALDRDDRALGSAAAAAPTGSRPSPRVKLAAARVGQARTRPALRARVRLRVEAPIGRVLVLRGAALAHRESPPSSCAGGRRGRRG